VRFLTLPLLVSISACGPGVAAVDSGTDAGPSQDDAGAPRDAGMDSGASDAGTPDAGGAIDAGFVDAGTADAGVPDAGVPDAGSTDAGASSDAGVERTGLLLGGTGPWPGPLAGVHYESGALSGVTDALGTYRYEAGGMVSFIVGDVVLGPLVPRAKLTAWQLAAGACTPGAELDKALVLLLSLDADGDPSNGTTLTVPVMSPRVALASLSLGDIATRIGTWIPGRAALTPAVAMDRFIRQVDDEVWTQLGLDTFSGTTALQRGQGVATDGQSWYFSGTLSLEKTDLQFNTQTSNSLAIPLTLALTLGSNHIGDIDVYNGTLYAPIEDGSAYQNPRLVQYGAQNLSAGTVFTIPQALQTKGVPWVAVDAPRGFLYFAEWDPTTQLNLFSLSTVTYLRSLTLTPPAGVALGRIQGAKVFEGALYLNTDDAMKTVYKLNLETGTVLRLFAIAGAGENEGLAFLARPDGSQMHTLDVNTSSSGSELRHHQRTRLPLRSDVCP
jgi:hypothetical protein